MQDLLGFARRHEVSWEIAPHFELKQGRFRHVGFDLTLHAKTTGTDPGSAAAVELHAALRGIALPVLPSDVRWEVEPYDASLHLRPETAWAPEVELLVVLRCREGTFDIVGPAEAKRARAIGAALTRRGIPEGVYRRVAA
jgi:hypothetical protein